ncbi:MAG TPA: ribonuclease E inhibitor RraB [Chitinophagaceae bacterium]|nr:ribonuclease E inhibitor RraB [Chitinophagaceae bacterium]
MALIKFTLLITGLLVFTSCISQIKETDNNKEIELINSIFDKMEAQGVNTKENLLYGYFFFDRDKLKLEKLKTELMKQSFRFVELDHRGNNEFILHVEKVEKHTRQSLFERGQHLKQIARLNDVSTYDGFDIGNIDPKRPLISNEGFLKFMNTKKGDQLFDLGIKLYDYEINDKAEIVFRECIKLSIKPDTSAYKLGNSLIFQNKIEEGIKQLEQATIFNPNYLYAFFNLGAVCYGNFKYEKSIQYYQLADKLKPNDDKIIYGIAASQFALKEFDKSLENCEKALRINKNNENAKKLMKMLTNKAN